ncbi:hypothetical protein NUW58_g525 [Xylaria curta]|uniref:Uncharacterized protein n=2 Tax=Xylaria curta TaxID=42375 RepID=A0ACC1PPW5_9PEZI|nr:hypothetical protein NUW58_g2204 [Xylaria curta]KAJ2997818.1 hypothetical protein NUW58_g525 [Xylaria curta]
MAGKFEPKVPVNLDPPKDDPITLEELSQADVRGTDEAHTGTEGKKAYVAIKASERIPNTLLDSRETFLIGKVYDVTGNKMYQVGGSYHVFAGKDASRALAKTSTKPEDVQAEWKDLDDKKKGVLNDWITFFSNRYNVVGLVQGATNTE